MSNGIVQEASFEQRLRAFAVQEARIGDARVVGYRAARGAATGATPLVLLHGIGSGSASWLQQLERLGETRDVYAWDAPGYNVSTPLPPASPNAADYALALAAWLDALQVPRAVLVGHSLGAIIAGGLAALAPQRIAGLLLISPAAGYGAAPETVRNDKRDKRLAMLAELGPAGLAEKRSGNMLSAHASETARDWVRWNMARVIPHGYAQATHLLANADLASDVARFPGRVAVAVGADDAITPPSGCERIAEAARVPLRVIADAGHAGYVEQPDAYTALIDDFCRAADAHDPREARP